MKKSFLICLIAAFLVMTAGIAICVVAQNKAEAENIDLFKDGFNENGELVSYVVAETPADVICSLILSKDDVWGTQRVPTLEQVLQC